MKQVLTNCGWYIELEEEVLELERFLQSGELDYYLMELKTPTNVRCKQIQELLTKSETSININTKKYYDTYIKEQYRDKIDLIKKTFKFFVLLPSSK